MQRACLENHQPKPRAGSGALSGRHFPYSPAHSGSRPAHIPISALSQSAASHIPARTENSGLGKLPVREARGAGSAQCACARPIGSPCTPSSCSRTWYGRDLVRPDGWRPPLFQTGAGFSNLIFGGVVAVSAEALEMEGQTLRGPDLCLTGRPAQQVSEEGARLQVLMRSFCLVVGKALTPHLVFSSGQKQRAGLGDCLLRV